MIHKVLIANRGEIALRILRACKEMGIKSVSVYSEADAQSLPVQLADEAICIGAPSAAQSYLKSDRLLSAAELVGADAIHPGYGFLSENSSFAEQCEACHMKFIGPSSKTIRLMGDKIVARKIAHKVGLPTIPGSEEALSDEKKGLELANTIGYPVIIKAAGGGGGKGMRTVYNAATFTKIFCTARMEAEKAFGNGAVYIEKYLEEPHHIEFQILADSHSHVIHVGERDCSLQRNYQKLIEEAPSTFLSSSLREKMGKAAVKLAEKCGYEGVGTVEFLVDKKRNFYFIEMNTRLQVEHTVTEEAMGIDLVQWQLRIANGEKLTVRQKDIRSTCHAIECRINAEDPEKDFLPCPGHIEFYHEPGGPGVRIDSHAYSGYTIPPYYDSMIGKLIAMGSTRDEAMARMSRALNEYLIGGIQTTIPLCKRIMLDPVYRAGGVTTHFMKNFLQRTDGNKTKQRRKK